MNHAQRLGARGQVYVSRSATLDYQDITGSLGAKHVFETARRLLTATLLSALPDPSEPGTYISPIRGHHDLTIRAYVVADGPFLVVKKVSEVHL